MSIRKRLLASLLMVMIVVSAVTIILSYRDARHEIQELFDAELAQSARVLFAIVLPQLAELEANAVQSHLTQPPQLDTNSAQSYNEISNYFGHDYENKLAFQIFDNKGNVLLQSFSAPDKPMHHEALDPAHRGFSDTVIGKNTWRVFSLWGTNNQYLIQVGERYDVREELTSDISYQLVTPAIFSLPILTILVWIAITRGLAPIQHLVQQVTRRDPKNLRSLTDDDTPKELQPLVHVLNDLFLQLSQAFEKERQFTDDAAHELRTPLAALRTQAQVALRATDTVEKNLALNRVIQGVDRSAHLLEQLLTLTRIDHAAPDGITAVEITDLLTTNLSELRQLAVKKAINLDFRVKNDNEIVANTNPYSLSILIRNLLENAINYAPVNGEVSVILNQIDHHIKIIIQDNGPGIEENYLSRIYDRFYRAPDNTSAGCGLGLSIVKRIATLYGINVQLQNRTDHSGLVASVEIPMT